MDTRIRVNPLVSSVVHMPFQTALRDLGCAPLPRDVFVAGIQPFLKESLHGLPPADDMGDRLWRAVLGGEVLAAEALEDGRILFHVRGALGRDGIDVRLMYEKDAWSVAAVTSIHRLPWQRTRLARWMGVSAAVVAAGLIGYALPHPESGLMEDTVAAWAAAHGYDLVKSGEVAATNGGIASRSSGEAALSSGANGAQAGQHGSKDSASKPANPPAPKTLTFTLKQGMSIHNLSVFLYQQHLVKDPVAFDMKLKNSGVDRHLRPGTYKFQSNMTEAQLIQALSHGPS